jgi:O-methyltransferase involved in polyketide biosynthesis
MRSMPGSPEINSTVPHPARVYDYWLGGKDNYKADRDAAEEAIKIFPKTVESARSCRAFLSRVVGYLTAEAGIRQFLDLGSGLPSAQNVHEVAQSIAPESRVVYVDHDPVVLMHARALLRSSPEGATGYIQADLRSPDGILAKAAETLDFSRPVAVMLLAVLHFVSDADDPAALIATLMDALPSGSYLVIGHAASDIDAEASAELTRRYNQLSSATITPRDRDQVARFFDGLEMVPPGVVPISELGLSSDINPTVGGLVGYCGIGRKP